MRGKNRKTGGNKRERSGVPDELLDQSDAELSQIYIQTHTHMHTCTHAHTHMHMHTHLY